MQRRIVSFARCLGGQEPAEPSQSPLVGSASESGVDGQSRASDIVSQLATTSSTLSMHVQRQVGVCLGRCAHTAAAKRTSILRSPEPGSMQARRQEL